MESVRDCNEASRLYLVYFYEFYVCFKPAHDSHLQTNITDTDAWFEKGMDEATLLHFRSPSHNTLTIYYNTITIQHKTIHPHSPPDMPQDRPNTL